jgi:hypothetical protein
MMSGKIDMFLFLNEEFVERHTLRQGDSVKDVHLLGAINLNALHYSSPAGNRNELASWNVPNKPIFGDAMIVSHSCEIARENMVKVTSIILAPLRDIHKATAKERIDELIKSNLIDQQNPLASFLKYFYIAPNSALEYPDGAIVDFSKIFSVRNKSYDSLLDKKIVQLTQQAASSMALMLALYFHRKGQLAP